MRKNNAIKVLMLTTALTVVGGIGAMQNVANVSADGSTFAVVATSIRTEDHDTNGNGLRFAMVMDNATYQTVTANANAEIGVLILPTDMVALLDNGLTLAAVSETGAAQAITYGATTGSDDSSVQVSGWTTSTVKTGTQDYTDGYMMSTVYVWGTPEKAYNRPMTAVAYYDTDTTNGTDDAVYSVSKSASLSEVALRDGVNTYLNNYEVKFFDESENVIESQTVQYGSAYTLPDMETTLQGSGTADEPDYLLEGWYAKQSNGTWGTELITELTPETVTKSMHFKAKLGDATAARWVAKVENNVVTDFTTGNYTRNFGNGYTYFSKVHSGGYPHTDQGAGVTETTIGGETGTYVYVGINGGSITNYTTIPYYLPNTMSVETLQEYADMGYTLKVRLYIDSNGTNEYANVYTVTSVDGALASTVANMRYDVVTTSTWSEVEIDINDYITLVTNNGADYCTQLARNRNIATLTIHMQGDYTVYFDSIKAVLPTQTLTNKIVSSPADPLGWYQKPRSSSTTTTRFVRAHQYGRLTDGSVISETIGGIAGTYAKLTNASGQYSPALIGYPTMSTSILQSYADQGYTMKLKLYVSSSADSATVRTLQYNWTDEANPARISILDSTELYTRTATTIQTNVWQEVSIDIKDYIADYNALGTDAWTQIKDTGLGTIAIKGTYGYTVYLGDMYLEAPTAEQTIETNEGETVTVEAPTATDGEAYEYYQVVDGKYTKLADNTVVAGASDFEIAVVKVTTDDNGKKVRSIYKAYKVNVTPATTTA